MYDETSSLLFLWKRKRKRRKWTEEKEEANIKEVTKGKKSSFHLFNGHTKST